MSEYDEARSQLAAEGWTKIAPCRFSKGNHELVFDTGTWIEVYEVGRGRIAEFKLHDFHQEIAKLDQTIVAE